MVEEFTLFRMEYKIIVDGVSMEWKRCLIFRGADVLKYRCLKNLNEIIGFEKERLTIASNNSRQLEHEIKHDLRVTKN